MVFICTESLGCNSAHNSSEMRASHRSAIIWGSLSFLFLPFRFTHTSALRVVGIPRGTLTVQRKRKRRRATPACAPFSSTRSPLETAEWFPTRFFRIFGANLISIGSLISSLSESWQCQWFSGHFCVNTSDRKRNPPVVPPLLVTLFDDPSTFLVNELKCLPLFGPPLHLLAHKDQALRVIAVVASQLKGLSRMNLREAAQNRCALLIVSCFSFRYNAS